MTDWEEKNMLTSIAKRQKFASVRRARPVVPDEKFARERRYDCGECRDSGFVTIFKPSTVARLKRDPETERIDVCAVMCDECDRLANHNGEFCKVGRAIPLFGSQPWHFNAHHPRARLDAAAYVHRPEGFIEAFAEHSGEGAT